MKLSQKLSAPAMMEKCQQLYKCHIFIKEAKVSVCFLEDLPPRLLTRIFHLLRVADIDINHHGDHDEISRLH